MIEISERYVIPPVTMLIFTADKNFSSGTDSNSKNDSKDNSDFRTIFNIELKRIRKAEI